MIYELLLAISVVFAGLSCGSGDVLSHPNTSQEFDEQLMSPRVIVLGVAQDAGFPQAGCSRVCCRDAWDDHNLRRFASSIAVVDRVAGKRWLFDCTPDFPDQLRRLDRLYPAKNLMDGIFLTHAHIGHYAGLIHLGREVLGARDIPLFAMPRMAQFLKTNGPWSQLVELSNVRLQDLKANQAVQLTPQIKVTPYLVPHRDEFSETVGYRIDGPEKSVLFLPDIDRWEQWEMSIEQVIRDVDVAYLDGTFFSGQELPGRDMSKIPHPTVSDSLGRFASLPSSERAKVRFIHLNHTNPLLRGAGVEWDRVLDAGCRVASQGEEIEL